MSEPHHISVITKYRPHHLFFICEKKRTFYNYEEYMEMQTIGAGALNQAVKAVAIARGFVAPSGINLICIPAFTDIIIDGEERTAIKLIVEPR